LLSNIIHAFGRALWLRRGRRPPAPESTRRIVATHFHYIGDVFFATAAIAALKRRFPGAAIDVVLKSRSRDVLLGNPAVREIIVFDGLCNDRTRERRTDWPALRKLARRLGGCDLLVDFTGVPASCALAALAGPRWSVGFSRAGLGFVFDREIWPPPNLPLVDRCNALAALVGADAGGPQPRIYLNEEDNPPPYVGACDILLHVGAGFPLKLWPIENFEAVARHFRARGLRVALAGGPNDRAEITNLSVRQVAAWARGCRVYVGLDTGMTHIVASLGVPTVAIYGPTNPGYLPRWPCERVVWQELPCSARPDEQHCAACRPMICSHHSCMRQLSAGKIIDEIEQCLSASSI
jgi:ADP-heptose:LPS heptosyltransferase